MTDKPQTTPEDFIDRLIKEHKEFAQYWYIIGFVEEPTGRQEDSEYFDCLYVDQSGPLSDAGDDFRGNCYIKMSNGKYLKTEYYT